MVWPLALATLGAAGISAWGQHRANKASAASAKDMMEFQQYNSDTSVRRAMKDMEAAGINPLLAGKYGASTPGGASYTSQNELEGASGSVGSAIQLKRMKAELANLEAQNGQISSQIELNASNAAKIRAETELLKYARLKEKMYEPLYGAGRDVVESAVSTGRDIARAAQDVWQGKAGDSVAKRVEQQMPAKNPTFKDHLAYSKQYARSSRKYSQFGAHFDID